MKRHMLQTLIQTQMMKNVQLQQQQWPPYCTALKMNKLHQEGHRFQVSLVRPIWKFQVNATSHFQVILCLWFKTSPCAELFTCKWIWLLKKNLYGNAFSKECFCAKTRLGTEAKGNLERAYSNSQSLHNIGRTKEVKGYLCLLAGSIVMVLASLAVSKVR